jgi:hypothetical protein
VIGWPVVVSPCVHAIVYGGGRVFAETARGVPGYLWVSCFVGRGETTVLISFSEGNSSHPSWLFWPSDNSSPAFSILRLLRESERCFSHAPTCGAALCTVLPRHA